MKRLLCRGSLVEKTAVHSPVAPLPKRYRPFEVAPAPKQESALPGLLKPKEPCISSSRHQAEHFYDSEMAEMAIPGKLPGCVSFIFEIITFLEPQRESGIGVLTGLEPDIYMPLFPQSLKSLRSTCPKTPLTFADGGKKCAM
jgi:hypothetical protein